MSREIRFRTPWYKDGVFQGFTYWGYLGDKREFTAPASRPGLVRLDDEPYIGIKGQNGKRIYAGDIGIEVVEMSNYNPGGGMGQPSRDQPATKWWLENRVAEITIASDGGALFWGQRRALIAWSRIKIIGNRHLTPELLK